MKKKVAVCVGLILLCSAIALVAAGTKTISVKTMPPVVVKTVPQAGDIAVDPATKEIKVTFSKTMMTKDMWSWVKISDDTFPTVAGAVKYLSDKKTCVLPVKLQAGKTYAIWINSQGMENFKDEGGLAAVPYLLVFQTKK